MSETTCAPARHRPPPPRPGRCPGHPVHLHPALPRPEAAIDVQASPRPDATRRARSIGRKTRYACCRPCRPSERPLLSSFHGQEATTVQLPSCGFFRARSMSSTPASQYTYYDSNHTGAHPTHIRPPHPTPHQKHRCSPPNCQITTRLGHFLRAPRPKDGTTVGTTITPAITPGGSAIPRHQRLHSTHHHPTTPPPLPPPNPQTPPPHPTHPGGLPPHREFDVALTPYGHRSQAAHPISDHPFTSFTPTNIHPCTGIILL